jgi:uncharacterized protein (TIGR03067 family)
MRIITMIARVTRLLVASLLFCPAPAIGQGQAVGVEEEVKKLQGTWRLVSEVNDGVRSENVPGKFEWVIKGQGVRDMVRGRELFGTTFRVSTERGRRAFDLMERDGTVATRAIYSVRGNTLTIAFKLDGRTRPTDFWSGEGSVVRIYHRDRQ